MSRVEYEPFTTFDHEMADLDLHLREPAAEILADADLPAHVRFARRLGRFVRGGVEAFQEGMGTLQERLSSTRARLGSIAVRGSRVDPSVEGVQALRTVTQQDTDNMWHELEGYYDPADLAAIRAQARGEQPPVAAQQPDMWGSIDQQLGLTEEEMARIRRAVNVTRPTVDA
jgi:hypothetical protein